MSRQIIKEFINDEAEEVNDTESETSSQEEDEDEPIAVSKPKKRTKTLKNAGHVKKPKTTTVIKANTNDDGPADGKKSFANPKLKMLRPCKLDDKCENLLETLPSGKILLYKMFNIY